MKALRILAHVALLSVLPGCGQSNVKNPGESGNPISSESKATAGRENGPGKDRHVNKTPVPSSEQPVDTAKSRDDEPKVGNESALVQVVLSYLKTDYSERYQFVHNGTKLKDRIANFYSDLPVFPEIKSVTITDINRPKEGTAIVKATVKSERAGQGFAEKRTCYARKTGGQWLVDWQATVGLNPITLKTFRATVPNQEMTLRIIAELSDYYNYQYRGAKATYLSIRLGDRKGYFIHGYVEKESKLGNELLAILQDGSEHEITVTVKCTGTEGSVVEIGGLVSKNWFID